MGFRESRGPLSEQEIGNLLAAVGNHEAKALLLPSMRPGEIYTPPSLRELMTHKQGPNLVWPMHTIPRDYCELSFGPIGLVTKQVLNSDLSTYGYIKTDSGAVYGDALAGHMLVLSEQNPHISLAQLLGTTQAPRPENEKQLQGNSRRSPLRRFRMFWELVTTSSLPMNEARLAEALNEDPGYLGSHLRQLKRFGFINYDSHATNHGFSGYALADGAPTELPGSFARSTETNTQKVYAVAGKSLGEFITADEVFKEIADKDKKDDPKYRKRFTSYISGRLESLAAKGYLVRRKAKELTFSEISLTATQTQLLQRFVEIVEKFTRGDEDFMAQGRMMGYDIVEDPRRFSALMLKAKENSPLANKTDPLVTKDRILSLLSYETGVTAHEIRRQLEELYKQNLGMHSVMRYMRQMKNDGEVDYNKNGNEHQYRLNLS